MNITVAGLGYVGLSLACLLSKHNNVVAIDIDEHRVADINNGVSPIKDVYIEAYLADRPATLHATTDSAAAYASADYIVIATPTNYDDVTHYFDTSSIESVLDLVQELNPRAIVVIKSTIPVGYTKDVSVKYPQLQIIFSPEFCARATRWKTICILAASSPASRKPLIARPRRPSSSYWMKAPRMQEQKSW